MAQLCEATLFPGQKYFPESIGSRDNDVFSSFFCSKNSLREQLITFAAKAAEEVECDQNIAGDEKSALVLAWKFLELLCDKSWKLSKEDIVGLLSCQQNDFKDGEELAGISYKVEKNTVEKYRQMLMMGKKEEALHLAVAGGMWGHAMTLATNMPPGSNAMELILARFQETIPKSDPIRTVYAGMAGQTPPSVSSCLNWQRTLGSIVLSGCNSQHSIELLQNSLANEGKVAASQFCSLFLNTSGSGAIISSIIEADKDSDEFDLSSLFKTEPFGNLYSKLKESPLFVEVIRGPSSSTSAIPPPPPPPLPKLAWETKQTPSTSVGTKESSSGMHPQFPKRTHVPPPLNPVVSNVHQPARLSQSVTTEGVDPQISKNPLAPLLPNPVTSNAHLPARLSQSVSTEGMDPQPPKSPLVPSQSIPKSLLVPSLPNPVTSNAHQPARLSQSVSTEGMDPYPPKCPLVPPPILKSPLVPPPPNPVVSNAHQPARLSQSVSPEGMNPHIPESPLVPPPPIPKSPLVPPPPKTMVSKLHQPAKFSQSVAPERMDPQISKIPFVTPPQILKGGLVPPPPNPVVSKAHQPASQSVSHERKDPQIPLFPVPPNPMVSKVHHPRRLSQSLSPESMDPQVLINPLVTPPPNPIFSQAHQPARLAQPVAPERVDPQVPRSPLVTPSPNAMGSKTHQRARLGQPLAPEGKDPQILNPLVTPPPNPMVPKAHQPMALSQPVVPGNMDPQISKSPLILPPLNPMLSKAHQAKVAPPPTTSLPWFHDPNRARPMASRRIYAKPAALDTSPIPSAVPLYQHSQGPWPAPTQMASPQTQTSASRETGFVEGVWNWLTGFFDSDKSDKNFQDFPDRSPKMSGDEVPMLPEYTKKAWRRLHGKRSNVSNASAANFPQPQAYGWSCSPGKTIPGAMRCY